MGRAKKLGRCGECLTLFKADATKCANCSNCRVYWGQLDDHEECQEGESGCMVLECKSELQESKTIIEDLKNKILELEEELKGANTALSEVGKKWTNTLQEKNQELKKVN